MIKFRSIALMLGLALFASGCKVHDGPQDSTTVNGLVTTQINQRTCHSNTPDDVNALNVSEDESPVDVNQLTPACVLPGG